MDKCDNMTCRSFKIVGSGIHFQGGRYVAGYRSIAAKRAGSKLFEKLHNDNHYKRYSNKQSIKFILGETTRGSSKTTAAYEVIKTTLDTPKEITKGNVTIYVRYEYTVNRLIHPDNEITNMQVSSSK